jgi:ZIP family zinc transporter
MEKYVLWAVLATVGTWLLTALGAAMVVFFRSPNPKILSGMVGFAAGVMVAASFWSLLQPAIEQAEKSANLPACIVVTIGFLLGAFFMWACDKLFTFVRQKNKNPAIQWDDKLYRMIMLVLSVTLHNIPEGLAVGVAFGALQNEGEASSNLMGAVMVAVGIGLQNLPEGAAVSLPLRKEGFSPKTSFLLGQASAMVEPIAGLVGVLLAMWVKTVLPYALSFAAGTMILVAVHDLIPDCRNENPKSSYEATIGIILGFATMMLLDVMLG